MRECSRAERRQEQNKQKMSDEARRSDREVGEASQAKAKALPRTTDEVERALALHCQLTSMYDMQGMQVSQSSHHSIQDRDRFLQMLSG